MNDAFDYIAEANCTLSNQFHGEKVTMAAARQIFDDFIRAGQRLDAMKKALFYGKGEDIGPTTALGIEVMTAAPYRMAGYVKAVLNAEEAVEVAQAEIVLHALIGIATESVEGIEALYKAIWGGKSIDRINVLEETGDAFWYHGVLLKALGSDFETEQRRNIAKLRLRFPDNFSEYDANNRDLTAERGALERFGVSRPVDPETALAAAMPEGDPGKVYVRCPECGLGNQQHRPYCPRYDVI
jgi:NTP pyrophosphatase (non-canonical NTP hydrolase)